MLVDGATLTRPADRARRRRTAGAPVRPPLPRDDLPPVLLPDPEPPRAAAAAPRRRRPRPAGRAGRARRRRDRGRRPLRRQAGRSEAEIAITVEDAWQHRGVGKRLARRLAAVATRPRLRALRRDDAARQPRRARPRAQARRPTRRALRRRRVRSRRMPLVRTRADASAASSSRLRCAARSARRYTNRRPDHVSSTAHTLLSTRPCASPIAHDVLARDRSRHTRCASATRSTVRPRVRSRARSVEATFELRASRREEQHDVLRAARLRAQPHTVGQRIERAFEPFRRAHERDACTRLDAELLGKGSPRVPRHEAQSIAVPRRGQSAELRSRDASRRGSPTRQRAKRGTTPRSRRRPRGTTIHRTRPRPSA